MNAELMQNGPLDNRFRCYGKICTVNTVLLRYDLVLRFPHVDQFFQSPFAEFHAW